MSKWEWKKLGEVCDFTRGLTYSKKDEVESSSNCILRSNNIDLQTNLINLDELKYIKDEIEIPQEKYVRKNTILICMSNGSKAHLGKVAYIDKDYDFAFGGFMGLLKPKCEINGKFVHLYLCSDEYKNFIKSLSDGANINNLKFDDLRKFEIPFPPLSEQKRIVKFLDEEFSKIDTLKTNAETNLKNAKELFETTLEKELNPGKYGALPSGWKWKKIGDVCSLMSGDSKANMLPDGKIAYVKVADMNLECNQTEIRSSSRFVDMRENDKRIFPVGTTIFPKRGGAILTNKKRMTSIPICCDLNIMGVIPGEEVYCKYLYMFFMGIDFSKLFNGASIPQINNVDVNPLLIPLPPLSVQKEIVARLDKLSENVKRLEANYKQIIANCDELKKSILKKTFEGES